MGRKTEEGKHSAKMSEPKNNKKKVEQQKNKTVKHTSTGKGKQSYVVQKGDTLSQIVWKQYHDLSYEKKIKKANGLENADEIYEGQYLVLPEYKK